MKRLRGAIPWGKAQDQGRSASAAEKDLRKAEQRAAKDAARAESDRIKAEQKAAKDQQRFERQRENARKAMARLDQEHEKAAKKAGLPIKLYRAWLADRTAFERDRISVNEKELAELYRAVAENKRVIVRKYMQLFGGAKGAQRAFEAEANILARYGYAPTSQGFAANNALTGIAVGSGEMVVSYVQQAGSRPPVG